MPPPPPPKPKYSYYEPPSYYAPPDYDGPADGYGSYDSGTKYGILHDFLQGFFRAKAESTQDVAELQGALDNAGLL